MEAYYEHFKALHIIAIIAWMAGMLYLPRLYVYHSRVEFGSEIDKTFQIMEFRLLKYIINPAMIASYVFGFILLYLYGLYALGGWFHVKFTAVILLSALHGLFAKWRKDFARGNNKYSHNFYRIINEVPTVLMIIAVFMVVLKPFE